MPYERFVMLLKSRSRTHHPNMHYSYTGGRRKNIPLHLDPPKNVLLLHWEWTPKICPIGYSPNKCSKFLLLSLKSSAVEKKHVAMQKLFIKKERDKKNGQMSELLKQWVLRCPLEKKKKKMNKIAPVFLQSCFQVSNERYVFKEHSRIRLATIYIHHTSTHMHILIWLHDSTLFGSEVWLYNICIASMLFHAFSTPMSST